MSPNQKGFTLVEILAVLVILGVIVGMAIPKFVSIDKNAEMQGINMAIVDLNGQEMKFWTEGKFSDGLTDQEIFDRVDYQINGYSWITINRFGGELKFKETTSQLTRTISTSQEPARWSLK
jgi:prepilin-type N-terminal cleavage/methylation domain-containing protein